MIRFVACVSALSLAATAVLLQLHWGNPVAVLHLAFALGIVPLIFAAMIHFVPVLTRSGEPSSAIVGLPVGAQLAGVLVICSMQGWVAREGLLFAAAMDGLAALLLAHWIRQRARASIGPPHPGWRWYQAALGLFLLALLAVVGAVLLPQWYRAWRLFHLHLNPLGFVGLAALGTLPLLLPTALKVPDPAAATSLRCTFWVALPGALLVAAGSVMDWRLAAWGAVLWAGGLLLLFRQWAQAFRWATVWHDGVAASLVAAAVGGVLLAALGVAHGSALLSAQSAVSAWFCGFLLPLVTGALCQLLPVWKWPGPQSPERLAMRAKLAAGGQFRAVFFLVGALLQSLHPGAIGGLIALLGVGHFLHGVILSVRFTPATR